MQDGEAIWAEAAAGVQADLDADVRAEAFEVFMAEAGRMRVQDRRGPSRVSLRCGLSLVGDLAGDGPGLVDGMLELAEAGGRRLLVRVSAVLTLTGPAVALRAEEADGRRPTLASRLREAWLLGAPVRVLLADGRWIAGDVVRVGADHVELENGRETAVVPFVAVEAWALP